MFDDELPDPTYVFYTSALAPIQTSPGKCKTSPGMSYCKRCLNEKHNISINVPQKGYFASLKRRDNALGKSPKCSRGRKTLYIRCKVLTTCGFNY